MEGQFVNDELCGFGRSISGSGDGFMGWIVNEKIHGYAQ